MADDNKQTAPAANAAAAPASTNNSNSPATSAQPQPGAAPASSLPAEYAGKSAEDIYNDLSSRYKDYDTIRERARVADQLKEYGYENPEQVKQLRDWAQAIAGAASQGKAIVFDPRVQQYRAVDVPSAPAQPQQQVDPYEGWEMLTPSDQAKRLNALVEQGVMGKVQQVAQIYEQRLNETLNQLHTRNDLFLTLMEQKLADPDLDVKQALDAAQKVTSLKGEDLIRWATDQVRAPRASKKQLDEAVAKAVAEAKATWQAEQDKNAAPILDSPRSWQPRNINSDGKSISKDEENRNLIRTFREKGWIRPN